MMSTSGEIELRVQDGVAVLTLNAPTRRNALTPDMARALVEAMGEIDATPEIGALVVRGAGGTFCSGGDVAVLSDAGDDLSLIHI